MVEPVADEQQQFTLLIQSQVPIDGTWILSASTCVFCLNPSNAARTPIQGPGSRVRSHYGRQLGT